MNTTNKQDYINETNIHGAGSAGLHARLVSCAVLGVLVFLAGRTTPNSGLEWRVLALAGLAFASSLFTAEIQSRYSLKSIPLPLWHWVLFAGSLALSPYGAALPAAFYGIGRTIFGPDEWKPLGHFLYAIMKPMVTCSLASVAYSMVGGSVLRPQAVDSALAVLAAAVVYVIVSVALTVMPETSDAEKQGGARQVIAGWLLCLSAGYVLAVLYAVAPGYVVAWLCVAAVIGGLALRESGQVAVEEEVEETTEAEAVQAEAAPVEYDSFTDPVTGLANERYLEMFLKRELSRSLRMGTQLSIAVFDLDGLRKNSASTIKDTQEALTELGERLKNSVREYDLVARHSPHRLLVVLPEASAEEAYEVATRLHRTATSAPISGKPVSASVGLATFPEHGSTPEELINSSHRVLNHGRFLGPNCVHVSHRLENAG